MNFSLVYQWMESHFVVCQELAEVAQLDHPNSVFRMLHYCEFRI